MPIENKKLIQQLLICGVIKKENKDYMGIKKS